MLDLQIFYNNKNNNNNNNTNGDDDDEGEMTESDYACKQIVKLYISAYCALLAYVMFISFHNSRNTKYISAALGYFFTYSVYHKILTPLIFKQSFKSLF
jgi:hypothetical protein